MNVRPFALIILPILYLIFWFAGAVSGWVGLVTLPFDRGRRLSAITRANDRTLSAILFADDSQTVSSHCGNNPDCRLCKVLCRILSAVLEKGHCEKYAGPR